MRLLAWDLIVPNDKTLIDKLFNYFSEKWLKFVYRVYNHNYCLFYVVWEILYDDAIVFYNDLNKIIWDKIVKVSLSLNDPKIDNVKILKWTLLDISNNSQIITFEISPNYDFDYINKNLLNTIISSENNLLIVLRTWVNDTFYGKDSYKIDVII